MISHTWIYDPVQDFYICFPHEDIEENQGWCKGCGRIITEDELKAVPLPSIPKALLFGKSTSAKLSTALDYVAQGVN